MPGGLSRPSDQESQSFRNVYVEDICFIEDDDNSAKNNAPINISHNLKSQSAGNELLSTTDKNNRSDKHNLDMSNKNDTIEKQRSRFIDLENRFKSTDSGPYLIFVEHIDLNIGRLHPMRLGEKLINLSEYDRYISEISNVGRNRIKIEVNSAEIANKLVNEPFFKNNDLVAYIPSYLTEKKGIIRFVDTSYSESTLLKIIKSDVPVKKVQRMYKTITKEDIQERVARQMIIVTFSGIHIPQFIYINKVRCEVNVYIQPVMQCYQCLRYGHSARQCKGKKRCRTCGTFNENDCTDCAKFCVFCKEDNHNSTHKDCPEYKKQKRTKEAMAHLNISFKEAEKVIDNPAYTSIVQKNRYAPLLNSNVDFPPLNSSRSGNASHNSANLNKHTDPISDSRDTAINPNKKRKKSPDRTPHFTPISREFKTSFCAGPVVNIGTKDPSTEITALKNKFSLQLKELVKYIVDSLQSTIQSSSTSQIADNLNFDGILNSFVNSFFT